jgi:hypothetical protein
MSTEESVTFKTELDTEPSLFLEDGLSAPRLMRPKLSIPVWKTCTGTRTQIVEVKEQSVKIGLAEISGLKTRLAKYVDAIPLVAHKIEAIGKSHQSLILTHDLS